MMSARADRHQREMTVANIREREGADYVEVVFLESARFYRLLKSNPAFDDALRLLRAGVAAGRPVRIVLGAPSSDVIEEVREPGV